MHGPSSSYIVGLEATSIETIQKLPASRGLKTVPWSNTFTIDYDRLSWLTCKRWWTLMIPAKSRFDQVSTGAIEIYIYWNTWNTPLIYKHCADGNLPNPILISPKGQSLLCLLPPNLQFNNARSAVSVFFYMCSICDPDSGTWLSSTFGPLESKNTIITNH